MAQHEQIFPSDEIKAATFLGLEKIGGKEGTRQDLSAGEVYPLALECRGKVMKKNVAFGLEGVLTVDHDRETAVSAAPNILPVLTLLLSFQPRKTQLNNMGLIEKAFENGAEPELPAELLAEVETLLKKIRKSETKVYKGALRLGQYSLAKLPT